MIAIYHISLCLELRVFLNTLGKGETECRIEVSL